MNIPVYWMRSVVVDVLNEVKVVHIDHHRIELEYDDENHCHNHYDFGYDHRVDVVFHHRCDSSEDSK